MEEEHPFTVAQLIAELQRLPPDMRVMTRGYEGGYHDCEPPVVGKVELNVNREWYYGRHDDPDPRRQTPNPIIEAAIL